MKARALTTFYAGSKYRSRTEARWAIFFDACGIRYDYEPEGYALPSGPYLPDFWLQGLQMFVEVKGAEPTDAERVKCRELAALSERPVLLAIGSPKPAFQLIWFDGSEEWSGEDDVRFVIAKDRNPDAGYWLVAEDDARWLGGGKVLLPRYGPQFSGAIEEAYDAALSARFEHGERQGRHPVIPEPDPERTAA